jgi:hypothetical protein
MYRQGCWRLEILAGCKGSFKRAMFQTGAAV